MCGRCNRPDDVKDLPLGMKLLEHNFIEARKAKDEKAISFYSTLVGELKSNAKLIDGVKTVPDADVLKACKKFLKNVDDVLSQKLEDGSKIKEQSEFEKAELIALLPEKPKQYTEEELTKIISDILSVADKPNMGLVMKALMAGHRDKFDGKMASEIAKKLINELAE